MRWFRLHGKSTFAMVGTERRHFRLPIRILVSVLPVLVLAWLIRWTGVLEALDQETLRTRVGALGWIGPAVFVVLYGIGMVVQVPAYIFIGAAVLLYGPLGGMVLSYGGALLANFVVFFFIRSLSSAGTPNAGEELAAWAPRPLQNLLERLRSTALWGQLDQRPYLVVSLIRAGFPANPVVSLAFAVSPVSLRPYLIGSSIGALPQLMVTVFLFAWALGP